MTNSIIVILICFILFLVTVYAMSFVSGGKGKYIEKEKEEKPKKKASSKSDNRNNVIDALDFMLANNIIDTKQYNELMVKSLPYIE